MTRWAELPERLKDRANEQGNIPERLKEDAEDYEAQLIIPGRPITKKNSQNIITNRETGKPMIIQKEAYREYEQMALWVLKEYEGPRFEGKHLKVVCRYYMPSKRSWPDLIGLMQATWDIIEKAQIIDNDRNIVNPDGSRIVGIDKKHPRAMIKIKVDEDYKIERS